MGSMRECNLCILAGPFLVTGEQIYGLGDRFVAFYEIGKSIVGCNADGKRLAGRVRTLSHSVE